MFIIYDKESKVVEYQTYNEPSVLLESQLMVESNLLEEGRLQTHFVRLKFDDNGLIGYSSFQKDDSHHFYADKLNKAYQDLSALGQSQKAQDDYLIDVEFRLCMAEMGL